MYSVLIVDDESLIRDGLKCIMNWDEIGFTICGEAANGEDALAAILNKSPDLVLMDIRMPKLPGLDVVRLSLEGGFQGKYIIISGYSDFKYAQEAIRYGVVSFLTKPIDEDELFETVTKIKKELDAKSMVSGQMDLLRQKAKDAILHDLVTPPEEIAHPLTESDLEELELIADVYQIVIYENFSLAPNATTYSFAELLKVSNQGDNTFNHFYEDRMNVILLKGQYALNRFHDFLGHYHGDRPPQKASPMDTLFLAYGRSVNTITEIYLSYQDALALVHRRFFCIQGQHTLGYEELPDITSSVYELQQDKLEEYTQTLSEYLQTFNRKKVAETLMSLEEYLYRVKNAISEVKLFLTDIYLQIKEQFNTLYSHNNIPFPSNSAVIECIDRKYYLYEIVQFLSEQFEMIMNAIGTTSRNSVLDDILYYIEHNYPSNIKLETIAPLFGYNSAYLGKIFHKTVGESFHSYIDHIRINHSKTLLLQGTYKVYEIAEMVGYRNVDYFHKKFRKYVGESPAEYRKKNGAATEEDE